METLRKLLVANRGEIACRIIKSCQRLGVKAVAVYSEADRNALHVEMADEAVAVGGAPARESYLNGEALLRAARETAVDAVHPGYGFLSENSGFARAVIDAGLAWVGPAPETIEAMGDKENARNIAGDAGVPTVPGTTRITVTDESRLGAAIKGIGFPLIVKATAGGGGIGMRRVESMAELIRVIDSTRSMAQRAFGDSGIYLERYVPAARHVEVQVFGFGDGTGVHLFDRDCTVQRRFQKIIEEAPAPKVPDEIRKLLYQAALSLVRHQRYRGAGTVEFIYDVERQRPYFLEMNTRIQVEHPVTEMVTGIDIVAWQIKQSLDCLGKVVQNDIETSGHAVECRLYAERPEKNFLPSPGVITGLEWPEEDHRLRIDHGLRKGDSVTPFYDPLIAKVVSHGEGREGAIERLENALDDLQIEGLRTNQGFLSRVLRNDKFRRANMTTTLTTEVSRELQQ